jgi:hypothetical protein
MANVVLRQLAFTSLAFLPASADSAALRCRIITQFVTDTETMTYLSV